MTIKTIRFFLISSLILGNVCYCYAEGNSTLRVPLRTKHYVNSKKNLVEVPVTTLTKRIFDAFKNHSHWMSILTAIIAERKNCSRNEVTFNKEDFALIQRSDLEITNLQRIANELGLNMKEYRDDIKALANIVKPEEKDADLLAMTTMKITGPANVNGTTAPTQAISATPIVEAMQNEISSPWGNTAESLKQFIKDYWIKNPQIIELLKKNQEKQGALASYSIPDAKVAAELILLTQLKEPIEDKDAINKLITIAYTLSQDIEANGEYILSNMTKEEENQVEKCLNLLGLNIRLLAGSMNPILPLKDSTTRVLKAINAAQTAL